MSDIDPNRLLDEPSYFIEHYLSDEPFGYQREFMDADSSRKAAVCGRRVGKSTMASWLALWYAITHGNAEILITAKAQRQSMELFNEVKKKIRQSDIDEEQWGITRDTRTEINFDNGSRILCLPVGTDGSNIRGYGTDLLNDFIEEQRKNLTPTQFRQEIKGEFVESADSFFTREELMTCASESVRREDNNIAYLGVDLASTGGDESVYVSIDGNGNVFDIEHTSNKSMTDAMGRVRELDSYNNYTTIMIDATGLGTGVVDQIKEDLGRKVQGFKFTNQKKQSLYNTLKNQLQEGALSYTFVPGKDEPENKLVDQCLQLEYEYTSSGKMKIHHPTGGHDDFSDAFALAVWAKNKKSLARSDKSSMKPFSLGSLK